MTIQRRAIFGSDEPSAQVPSDTSDFAPTPARRPDVDQIRKIASERDFTPREPISPPVATATASAAPTPAPSQRRYRTGRDVQLSLKVDEETRQRFYALADAQGIVLGETLKRAIAALEEKLAAAES